VSGDIVFKMTGSGNDFVFLDGRWTTPAEWPAERIERVCARGTGVGADGLVILEPGSQPGAVRFLFYNRDGHRAAMCGNAALCAARLSALIELAPPERVVLETDAGLVRARCVPGTDDRSELELPDVGEIHSPSISPEPGEEQIALAIVGVPHLVVRVQDLDAVPLISRGRELRRHPALAPAGANVNFVAQNGGGWTMRTYERGVEDETLACGTGAVACAVVLNSAGIASLPFSVQTRSGTTLQVSGTADGGGLKSPHLKGEARLVFRATLGPGL
jgi:diaminopimelate epimerase